MEPNGASLTESVSNDSTDVSPKKQHEAGLPTVLFLSALIYLGLYGFFIFGNAVYMYSDIGSDSLSSSYPIITMLARLFQKRQFSFYTLESGLGSDTSAIFLQYINPLKFLLLNFGRESFPVSVLLFVFLQHVFTAVFAYGFFKSLLGAKRPAVFAALIWGYTSYIIVWGQNYSFGVCILLFTAVMFFLQLLLSRPSRLYFMLLTFTLALFIFSNYYFFYMTGVFTIFYVIFFTLSVRGTQNRFVRMIKSLFTLALSAIFSMAIACAAILPIVMNFLGSARTGDTMGFDLKALLTPYGMKAVFTFLGRFFSASIMGSGSDFTGYLNFYETALLYTSSLFFFALVFVLMRKKSVIQAVLVVLLTAGMLYCPAAGKHLTFNVFSQRYSFMICFAEVIAIGVLLKDILSLDMKTVPAFYISVLGTPIVTAGLLWLLYMRRTDLGYTVNKFAFLASVASIAVWTFWLIFAGLMKNKRPATVIGV
ncbi:MAG: YfhO family protein, partial [Lachnospiraceae bacterium]|nr:YfhO family protein [Lachnospiraceae bacterium]